MAVPGLQSQQEHTSPNAQGPFTPLSALGLFVHAPLVKASLISSLGPKGDEIDGADDGRNCKVTLQERRGKEGRAYGRTCNLPQSTPATDYSPSFHMRSTPLLSQDIQKSHPVIAVILKSNISWPKSGPRVAPLILEVDTLKRQVICPHLSNTQYSDSDRITAIGTPISKRKEWTISSSHQSIAILKYSWAYVAEIPCSGSRECFFLRVQFCFLAIAPQITSPWVSLRAAV